MKKILLILILNICAANLFGDTSVCLNDILSEFEDFNWEPIAERFVDELPEEVIDYDKYCMMPIVFRGAAKQWPAMNWSFEYFDKMTNSEFACYTKDEKRLSGKEVEHSIKSQETLNFDFCSSYYELQNLADTDTNYIYNNSNYQKRFVDNFGLLMILINHKNREVQMHLHPKQDAYLAEYYGKKLVILAKEESCTAFKLEPHYANGFIDFFVNEEDLLSFKNINYIDYPGTKDVIFYFTVVEPGDILLIPFGWFHYVKYLETSIGSSLFLKTDLDLG